ncbi:hypothetical protein FHS72_000733 [Loktanella ponticola]|uniref:Uncharacterized protein n=1 Tax=Yoonia ponticola TaxID=1524255 RepID=A0A7W9BIV4_9RHOB|nr:hypothetical protein [Yoonia ponticola]MBB5721126.1 hypothetical protein [Yoonia ponticola]
MTTPPIPIGRTIFEAGIITQQSAIAGKNRFDVERCMGFNAGQLSMGYTVAHLQSAPKYDDWTFRRYTQMAGHAADWDPDEMGPDTRTAEEALLANGYTVDTMKNEVMMLEFHTSGPRRLIKIIPVANSNGWPQYPEGAPAPQWILHHPLAMTVAAFVGPQDTYTT